MTISSTTSRIGYTGDGATTVFSVPFYFQANADLVVILQDTTGAQSTKVLGTDYTLSGATVAAGGTLTFTTAPPTGYLITIYRDPPLTQATSYNNNDPFPAKAHELALDKAVTIDQRTRDIAVRGIHISDGESSATVTALASIANRKNRVLGFDTNGALTYVTGPAAIGTETQGVAVVDTKSTAQTLTYAVSINVVRTCGNTVAGDGGGLDYIRGIISSPTPWQDASGGYWTPATLAGLASQADAEAGVLNTVLMTPLRTAQARTASLASQADAEAGVLNTVLMTPLRTAQARTASLATQAQAEAGTLNTVLMTPLRVAQGLPTFNALQYGVVGDGATNDAAAINTFLTTVSTKGMIAYFPGGKTYLLGSSQIVVPDGVTVICGQTATFTRSVDPGSAGTWSTNYGLSTGAMISIGNHCRWSGGILNNTAVLGTSATSWTTATGAKTFTVGAGLNIVAGNFLRFQSSAAGSAHAEGTVTSYSGTSLVMSFAFAAGSGAHTDWNIFAGAVYQCPMVLHGVTESVVENVRTTGNWYVGLLMDGWNPGGGGNLNVLYCTFRNCWSENVMNRGFYTYGNCNDNVIDGCTAVGGSGATDYGFNMNPANATGTANGQLRNKISNCTALGTAFQGFEVGDLCDYNTIIGCTAQGVTDPSGAGFLIQLANAQVPNYNRIIGCIANNCPFGYEVVGASYGGIEGCLAVICTEAYRIAPSGATQCTGISINNSEANTCTTGFNIAGNSSRCDLNGIKALNNSGTGVNIQTGAVRTLVTGRSFNNGTNLVDGGTTSVTTGLTVV